MAQRIQRTRFSTVETAFHLESEWFPERKSWCSVPHHDGVVMVFSINGENRGLKIDIISQPLKCKDMKISDIQERTNTSDTFKKLLFNRLMLCRR
jgi:hypothetical protein